MKLTFLGADHEVTGSCHFLQACGRNILVDCGMEQGNDVYENQQLPIPAADVDYVLLTHAHIDHSGLIPLLYVNGFRGDVFTTVPTVDLCEIMLKDSAHIQMFEAEWRNRKSKRSGGKLKEFVPLYDIDAAVNVLKQFVGVDYEQIIDVCEGIKIRFRDVGHLLGSASIEVWVEEDSVTKKIVFSGDIGNVNKPIVKDPVYVKDADYVVMESTYGNRSHGGTVDHVSELVKIFNRTFDRGGNVVIPSFAVGRTQELLYYIRKIKEDKLMDRDFDVYMDSPLAIEATNIFNRNVDSCFDEEAMELIRKGINPLTFPGLKFAVSSEDSKMINFDQKPKVIISASGMCEAGRIRHHLKHNLWRPECTILFVGYQANGTTGRIIVDGAKEIKLFGEPIEINAEIVQLQGASGHADKEGLLNWINSFTEKPEKVFVVHGEDEVCEEFTACLRDEYGYDAVAPYTGASFNLTEFACLEEGHREKKSRRVVAKKNQTVYDRLIAAGKRLMVVITHNEGGTNKDLAKFADQINNLCEKWDR
ncbi:MAG: MBL fold metallo-hydrolase [Eubacteriales bacterium]|nr:MBL fold metallo-hydrolase [Eubacteriales bacterium]